jgi:hypothetical protein
LHDVSDCLRQHFLACGDFSEAKNLHRADMDDRASCAGLNSIRGASPSVRHNKRETRLGM